MTSPRQRGQRNSPELSDRKDIVHVGAVLAFGAETLDVVLAQGLDEVVVALDMFHLAVVTLQEPAQTSKTSQKTLFRKEKSASVTRTSYLDAPSPQEVATEQASVHHQPVLLLELRRHEPASDRLDIKHQL